VFGTRLAEALVVEALMKTAKRVLVTGSGASLLCALFALAGQSGCVLASPTYVTTQTEKVAADASTTSTTQSSTPAGGASCQGGKFAKVDVSKLTPCGNGGGHCYDKAKVPFAEQMTACPDASQVCVPDEILAAGGDKLPSCTSIIGPGGCINAKLVPEIERQGGSSLKPDVCKGAGQLCVPCKDPTHGDAPTPFCQPIGVFEEACTAGAGPAADAGPPPAPPPQCCQSGGRYAGICIASSAIPEGQRAEAIVDTCTGDNKCVPADLATGQFQACNAGPGSRGVCMDTCFNGLMAIAGALGFLQQDWCRATEVCVPCSQLQGRGVPGCG
jgi:hypothetical protein